jgi:predicted nucleotidyltransferase
MADPFKIAEAFVSHIKSRYPDDIAVVFYYGSQSRGTASPDSDIDICLIPSAERGWQADTSFIIDGVGYDFWPMSWERAERISELEEPLFPILLESKVLYSRSEDDLARFERLKKTVLAYSLPDARPDVLNKALRRLKDSYAYLYSMRASTTRGERIAHRMELHRVISSVTDALSIAGLCTSEQDQVGSGAVAAAAVEASVERLIAETDGERALVMGESLVEDCRRLLLSLLNRTAKSKPFAEALSGYYEEAKSTFNKIVRACDRGDRKTAFLHMMRLQWDISYTLAEASGSVRDSDMATFEEIGRSLADGHLPLVSGEVNDLAQLKAQVVAFEQAFVGLLESNHVPIKRFASVGEFIDDLELCCPPLGGR